MQNHSVKSPMINSRSKNLKSRNMLLLPSTAAATETSHLFQKTHQIQSNKSQSSMMITNNQSQTVFKRARQTQPLNVYQGIQSKNSTVSRLDSAQQDFSNRDIRTIQLIMNSDISTQHGQNFKQVCCIPLPLLNSIKTPDHQASSPLMTQKNQKSPELSHKYIEIPKQVTFSNISSQRQEQKLKIINQKSATSNTQYIKNQQNQINKLNLKNIQTFSDYQSPNRQWEQQLQYIQKSPSDNYLQNSNKSNKSINILQSQSPQQVMSSTIYDDDDIPQGRSNLTRNTENRLKKKSKINLKMILKIIEKDMEKKLSQKQKQQLKTHKAISSFLKESEEKQKEEEIKKKQKSLQRASSLHKFKINSDNLKEAKKEEELIQKQGRESLEDILEEQFEDIKIQQIQNRDQSQGNRETLNSLSRLEPQNGNIISSSFKSRLYKIQNEHKKMRDSVQNEMDRRELNMPVDFVQRRITNLMEQEAYVKSQKDFLMRFRQIEEEHKNQSKPKRFQLLPFPLQNDQSEFRNVNLLFNQKVDTQVKTLQDYHKDLDSRGVKVKKKQYDFISETDFDFNKYHAVSPFQKTRNSFNLNAQSGVFSPSKTQELKPAQTPNQVSAQPSSPITVTSNLDQDKSEIDKILKKCNFQHNSLAHFCKTQGRKIQKRFEYLDHNQESVLRQIDVARDMLFMDLCKRDKIRAKFRDLIDQSLNDDLFKKAEDLQHQYYNQRMLEFYGGRYTVEQLNQTAIRQDLLKQYLDWECLQEHRRQNSLAEDDSYQEDV